MSMEDFEGYKVTLSVILVENSLNCTLIFSFIHNSGSVQQWKDSVVLVEKLLRSFGLVL